MSDDFSGFDRLLASVERRVSSPPVDQVAQEVCETVAKQIADSFERREGPDGEQWAPLKGPSNATGRMRDMAIDAAKNGTVTAEGYRSQPMQGDVWKAQNDGDPARHIPPRPFWRIGKATAAKVLDILLKVFR